MNFVLEEFAELASTNTFLLNEPNSIHGRAVMAVKQTQGQGRRGRAWHWSEGNLALSLGLQMPTSQKLVLPWLPFWLGVAAVDSCRRLLAPATAAALGLKWPNDIYVQNEKLGGILAQVKEGSQGIKTVVGIGINIRAVEGNFESTSLETLGVQVTPRILAESILQHLQYFELSPSLAQEWEERCVHLGKEVRFGEMGSDQWHNGICLGLDSGGGLRVRVRNEEKILAAEELSLRF